MKVLILSIIVVLIDQVSKLVVRFSFEYGVPHKLLGSWLRLKYIENEGMAFGIQVGGQAFFIIFSLFAIVVIFIYLVRARAENAQLRISFALILGGAIGNLIDRFLYGKVVDFIEIIIVKTSWPIFNLADAAVTVGMFMLIFLVMFDKKLSREDEGDGDIS